MMEELWTPEFKSALTNAVLREVKSDTRRWMLETEPKMTDAEYESEVGSYGISMDEEKSDFFNGVVIFHCDTGHMMNFGWMVVAFVEDDWETDKNGVWTGKTKPPTIRGLVSWAEGGMMEMKVSDPTI